MRVNEEEIAGSHDVSPMSVKKKLKKSGKQPLSEVLKDVPSMGSYLPTYDYSRAPYPTLLYLQKVTL